MHKILKPEYVKIISIVFDSRKGRTLGLGDDGRLYSWDSIRSGFFGPSEAHDWFIYS